MVTTTRMTLDEFLAIPDVDERRLELIDGEVIEKVSPRWGHGRVALVIGRILDEFGFAAVEPRAIIPASGDRGPSSPLPDVAFYLSDPPQSDDWMRRPPDVAVEVVSPGQSRTEMRAKVDIYRAFGIRSSWVIDLERQTVDIYEGDERRTYSGDTPIVSGVIPALSLTAVRLFDEVEGR